MTDKIKILYLAANPSDTSHVRVAAEARELTERIRQGPNRDAFEIVCFFAVRPKDLLRGLQEVRPHIMHFSGHGTFDKEIVLETQDGTSQPIAPQVLTELVDQFRTNLKVAVMSCCFGRRQAKALNKVLDFTIGMEKPISDTAAVKFSANFYQVLVSGGSIKQAFEGARLVTIMQGRKAFEKADLLVREGVNPNEPFINLLPEATEIADDTVNINPANASVFQQVSGGAKVGGLSVTTGDNNTTNTTVSFNEH